MARRPSRQRDPGAMSELGWFSLICVVVFGLVIVLAAWAGSQLAGVPSAGLSAWLRSLVGGESTWTAAASAWTFGILLALAALVGVPASLLLVRRRRRPWADPLARSMASGRDLAELEPAAMSADATRLGATDRTTGVPLGASVRTSRPIFGSLEWVQLWIMGPRAGKTSCVCVRQVVETPGPVLATTNKRDLVDLTRGPRSELGAVWVNDPQSLIGEGAHWWWNPLSYVTDVSKADQLASLFAAATRDASAKSDAYFDSAAKNLVASLLLAAAEGRRPITSVYQWLTHPDDSEPLGHLLAGEHTISSQALEMVSNLTPKQRDGVYGTALEMVSFLRNERILPWVTPTGPADRRPQLDPHRFVTTKETLYLISREGRGSARALTAALTVAVVEAAEDLAAKQPRGRLTRPLTCVLDEAANVCRWPELPDLYSHYGSRGIVISTFLQSWSQGVQVWGKEGMEKLWSAANVRGVGSGIAEADFLDRVSRLVGDHDVRTREVSHSKGGRTTAPRLRRERILDTADLAGLPRGRAVLFVSGMPASLLRLVHWSEAPYAASVRASEGYFGDQEVSA